MFPKKICNRIVKTRSKPVEVILNNKLDKEFKIHILPLTIMQFLTCNLKYSIRDSYITSNCLLVNSITVVSAIVFAICNFIVLIQISSDPSWRWYNDIFNFSECFNNSFYIFGFFVNALFTIQRSQIMVTLILKMNKTYVHLKTRNYKSETFIIWFLVVTTTLGSVVITSLDYLVWLKIFDIYLPIASILIMIFDFNVIQSIFLIQWLRRSVEIWIDELKKCKADDNSENKITRIEALLETYDDVLESYSITKNISQEMVSEGN